jgi:hypothetical protein
VEGAVGPGLFESIGGGVDGLSSGGEGARSQHLDMLGMADFGASIDDFLSSLEKFLGELSKLKNFSFDERIPKPTYSVVDELLIRLPVFKQALSEWGKRRLGTVAWSSL